MRVDLAIRGQVSFSLLRDTEPLLLAVSSQGSICTSCANQNGLKNHGLLGLTMSKMERTGKKVAFNSAIVSVHVKSLPDKRLEALHTGRLTYRWPENAPQWLSDNSRIRVRLRAFLNSSLP
ncbi:MAG: hypothetical protein WCI18_15645 [Pseudomonadota bacterium]